MKKFLFFFVLCLQLCCFAEEPFSLYLTWQHSPESTMSIQWITGKGDVEDKITFKKEGDEQWYECSGWHQPMPDGLPYFIHYVELTDLAPSSSYNFHVGKEEKVYKFRTMPKELTCPLHFIVGGDMYNGTLEMLEKTNRAAAAMGPGFVVIGGDIAYSCKGKIIDLKERSERWLDWLSVWNKTMISPEGYLIPILPTIGNHEVRGGKYQTPREAQFFYALFPMQGSSGSNVLDFGNYMSFIFLDSGHTHPIPGRQTQWLESVLSSRVDRPNKFAIYHVPAYPSVGKYQSKQSSQIRANWVPLFEKYGLNIAFENNDHAYKRSHPLLRNRVDPKGVLYMGDGAWSVANVRTPKTPKQAWYIAKSMSTLHFIKVTLEGTGRRCDSYTPDGLLIDQI